MTVGAGHSRNQTRCTVDGTMDGRPRKTALSCFVLVHLSQVMSKTRCGSSLSFSLKSAEEEK
jgi:hypothetical protein